MEGNFKIVVYVPESHGDQLREVMAGAVAGGIGNYSHCTFTVSGTGRFRPEAGANLTIGEVGKLKQVAEERIETVCESERLEHVLKTIECIHPYEAPATDVYPLESL